jgi:hypothetical protein
MGGYSVTVVVVRGHRWLGRRKLVGLVWGKVLSKPAKPPVNEA